MNKIDIVILNYNGIEILPQCLPSIVEAAKKSPIPCQVIILDNKSNDGSLDYIRKTFPHIKVVISNENKVLFSYNDLIPKLESEIVILLNNDIKVEPDFIAPLIRHFSSPSVFAVAPKQMNFGGLGYNGGKNKIEFNFGIAQAGQYLYDDNDPAMEKAGYTFYNANAAYDRKKFVELGCFDEIYAPFTWEDTDIGYRAWKSGYKFIYEPKSVIYHIESYTFDKEGRNIRDRRVITRRNSFIFTWKNITDMRLLASHIALLPINLFLGIFYDWARIAAFFEASLRLPAIIKRRRKWAKKYVLKDSDIPGKIE